MDIHRWLAETETPTPFGQPAVEPFLLPKKPNSVPGARRKRKRSSTDSSLLKAPSPQPRRKGVLAIEPDRLEAREAVDRARSDVSHSTRSDSASNSSTGQRYARKPRRKTCLDRYETDTKKGRGPEGTTHPSRKRESRKSKRRPKRKKSENAYSRTGQNFHAKNVPKDRLTLRPLEKMGLFSKGRTSASLKGHGLPDLVFSEMRFLHQDHGRNENDAQGPDAKIKRKKDHARTKEGDISAFFTSVRSVPPDTTGNKLTKGGRRTTDTLATTTSRNDRDRERQRSAVLDTTNSTVELGTTASHLDLGNRQARCGSISSISWSESLRAPTTPPGRRDLPPAVHGARLDPSNQEKEETQHVRHASAREHAQSMGCKLIGAVMDQSRLSSVAPMQLGLSKSQSSPQHPSSPPWRRSVDRAAKCLSVEGAASRSSMPPTLRAHGFVESQGFALPGVPASVRSLVTLYTNESAVTADNRAREDSARRLVPHRSSLASSGLSEVLRRCSHTSQAQRQRTAPGTDEDAEMRYASGLHEITQQSRRGSYEGTAKIPTVRFPVPDTSLLQRPNFSGPSFYAQQRQRQHCPADFDIEGEHELQCPDILGQNSSGKSGLSNQEHFEGLSEEPVLWGRMEGFDDDDVAGLVSGVDGFDHVRGAGHVNVAPSGFWRPNKLY